MRNWLGDAYLFKENDMAARIFYMIAAWWQHALPIA